MDAYASATEAALADPDPWHGFTTYIETICAMQAEDRGFADVLTMTFPTARGLEAKRHDAHRGVTQLIEKAKAAGKLRQEFTPEDIVILLIANAGAATATRDAAPEAWRQLVGYLLQAFAITEGAPLPESPASRPCTAPCSDSAAADREPAGVGDSGVNGRVRDGSQFWTS